MTFLDKLRLLFIRGQYEVDEVSGLTTVLKYYKGKTYIVGVYKTQRRDK